MPHNGAPEVRGHLCGLLVCFLGHVLSKGHFIFTIFFPHSQSYSKAFERLFWDHFFNVSTGSPSLL